MKRAGAGLLVLLLLLLLWQAWRGRSAGPRFSGEREGVEADAPRAADARGGPGSPDAAPTSPASPSGEADGTASLFLEVLSAGTRTVEPMRVDLWRAGKRERMFDTPGTARDLVPGEYRAVCLGARFDSEDPPPFRVEGETRLQLVVPTPRRRDVTLLVVDRAGRPMVEGVLTRIGDGKAAKDPSPAWAEEKAPFETSQEWQTAMPRRPMPVRSSTGVYTLGPAWDDDRSFARTWQYEFRAGDGNRVWIKVDGANLADRYVGAIVREEELLRPVVTPSGEPVARLAPKFEAVCLARPWTGADAWRRLEVSVSLEVPDLPDFRYAYLLAAPPRRVEMWSVKPPVPR